MGTVALNVLHDALASELGRIDNLLPQWLILGVREELLCDDLSLTSRKSILHIIYIKVIIKYGRIKRKEEFGWQTYLKETGPKG